MTDLIAVQAATDELARTFSEFRSQNDARLATLERKGSVDPLQTETVDRLNGELTRLSEQVEQLGTALRRPGLDGGRSIDARGVEHKQALLAYLRKGNEAPLQALEAKALSVGSDPDGGYLVGPEMSDRIVQRLRDSSPMRQVAGQASITSDAIEGILDLGEPDIGWTAELGTRAETATPALGQWRIPVHEMYAEPRASQKLLDDAAFDVEAFLAARVAEKMGRAENTAFVSGNGVGRPRGFLSYPTAASTDAVRPWGTFEHVGTGTAGAFAASNPADPLMNAFYALKAAYRAGAVWMMAKATVAATRLLKEATTGQYLWQPGLTAGQPATLLGHPVMEAEDMPSLANGSLSIAFGNFAEGYLIVDRAGIRTLRDPYTAKPQVKFYTTRRVGGDVLNFDAIKLVRFA
ncbi:phage major capsid protein [Zavarzinia sp. CC-PAN008]|uniref:phage major capsid protein n=1 Tax=Zavarzinia sp. CC-PAN008 TaxID=3243332 RepID=UPI003F745931